MTASQELMEMALEEFDQARTTVPKEKGRVVMRQSAEKMWLAVMTATDEYLRYRYRETVPKGREAHGARVRWLNQRNEDSMLMEYRGFRDGLHGDIFYDDQGTWEEVRRLMARAADYVRRYGGRP